MSTATDERYRAAVADVVAAAPPITSELRARLRALLAPVTAPKTAAESSNTH
jgi:hypothetical protein